MTLRTVLIGLLVVLCIYIAWLVMRWRRVQRQARRAGSPADRHANVFRDIDRFGAIPVGGAASEIHTHHSEEGPIGLVVDTEDDDSVVSLSSRAAADDTAEEVAPARAPRPAEPDASSFGFDALLEMRQTRHIVDELRSQHARLAEDVARLREELAALRAASRVAPAYAEAVSMVQSGLDAEAIAERCGISVAEAELVRALSQQGGQDDAGLGADETAGTDENDSGDAGDGATEQRHDRGSIHG